MFKQKTETFIDENYHCSLLCEDTTFPSLFFSIRLYLLAPEKRALDILLDFNLFILVRIFTNDCIRIYHQQLYDSQKDLINY
jgi:hypothetical protein